MARPTTAFGNEGGVVISVAAERWGAKGAAKPHAGSLARPIGFSLAFAGVLAAVVFIVAPSLSSTGHASQPGIAQTGFLSPSTAMGDVSGCAVEDEDATPVPFSAYSLPIPRDLPIVDTTGAI